LAELEGEGDWQPFRGRDFALVDYEHEDRVDCALAEWCLGALEMMEMKLGCKLSLIGIGVPAYCLVWRDEGRQGYRGYLPVYRL
jgi:hypothetical protein